MIYDSHCHLDLMPSMIEFAQNAKKKQHKYFSCNNHAESI